MKVATEEAARRLAKAIVADIVLYQGVEGLSSDAAAEGRQLFASRVDPNLLSVFEEEIAARRGGAPLPPPSGSAHRVGVGALGALASPTDTGSAARPGTGVEIVDGGGGTTVVIVALAVLLLALGVGAFFLVQ